MSELTLAGVVARCLEPDALAATAQSRTTSPGPYFRRFFDAALYDPGRAGTASTGPLDERAACALIDCVLQTGQPFGAASVEAHEADAFPARFLELVAVALDDEGAAQRLLDGGVLDRLGAGRHFFGSLPLRVIARRFSTATRDRARALLRGGWDEDVLNLLESAALRAQQHGEELLVLTPTWREASSAPREHAAPPPAPPVDFDVLRWLELASELHATDVSLIAGQPVALHGPFGRRAPDGRVVDERDVERVLSALLDARHRERFERERAVVTGFGVEGLGRFRLTALSERGQASLAIRTHFVAPELARLGLPPHVVAPLPRLDRGLVVLASPPGHGRSTLLSAVLQAVGEGGQEVVALADPLGWPTSRGPCRLLELHSDLGLEAFGTVARTLPRAVVGLDLLDDASGAELALQLASEGALVFLTLRALSASSALHTLAALDARRARRRLAESLAGVASLRLVPSQGRFVAAAELLLPQESLRRHLRGN